MYIFLHFLAEVWYISAQWGLQNLVIKKAPIIFPSLWSKADGKEVSSPSVFYSE